MELCCSSCGNGGLSESFVLGDPRRSILQIAGKVTHCMLTSSIRETGVWSCKLPKALVAQDVRRLNLSL